MSGVVKPSAAVRRPARHDEIAKLYVAGRPVLEIAALTGVCEKTVRNVATRRGLLRRNVRKPERNRLVLERYLAGDPVAEIANAHGITHATVRQIAARANIPARVGWQRRYPIDEPSPVGWWLVGLLAADGSINAAENRISLCQTVDDADVLHAFYTHVGCPERPLTQLRLSDAARGRQWNRRPAAEARVFSRRLVEALARHGVVPRKSHSMRLSAEAAQEAAVWLGVLDGDGTVGIWGERSTPQIVFSGSRAAMEQCEQFWKSSLPKLRSSARLHRRSTWTFGFSGASAVGAAKTLLAASPTSHLRKRAVLQQIAGWKPAHPLRAGSQTTIVSLERRQSS